MNRRGAIHGAISGCLLLLLALALAMSRPAVASSYQITFNARMGSPTGHIYMVMHRVDAEAGRARLAHFGFFAAHDGLAYVESLVGTPGAIGALPLDYRASTAVRWVLDITEAQMRL